MSYTQRHLPHLYVLHHPLFVTFCLHRSLPQGRQFFATEAMKSGKSFVLMDRLLDTNLESPRYLTRPEIAQLVVNAILKGAEGAYDLHSWVVMPNHVHLLITPHTDVSRILQRLKGSTAFQANKLLTHTGPFWQDESYDRLVRDQREFAKIQTYIEENPVRAGLVKSAEDYQWSSIGGLKAAAG